jgi:hypothetical protein
VQNRLQSLAALCTTLVLAACASTDEDTADGAVRPYPLDTCIIMDSKLGSMGDPITKVYNGQEIKFCCQPCVEEFEQNPEEYLARLPK